MTRSKEIPPIVTVVADNIAAIIKLRKLKIRHVSASADMDEQALRRYLKSEQIMGIDKIHRIATALGVQVGDLFKSEKDETKKA
jgi:transcriptional regulator with XRE-family HTH domain